MDKPKVITWHDGTPVPLEDDGTLPVWAWPGGYPIVYVTREGDSVCAACAHKDISDPVAADPATWATVQEQGDPESCAECSTVIGAPVATSEVE